MTDLNCFLAGMVRLLTPLLLLIYWHKRTSARFMPALAALLACFPAFIIAGMIRSGFDHSNLTFYLKQGILYGIFEEGTKFLVMRYLLTSYDSIKDAVTYGIGHSAFEAIGGGFACLNLIGTDRAAPDILFINVWTAFSGTLFAIPLTFIIFYGIRSGKPLPMLLTAMLFHTVGNAATGLFMFSKPIVMLIDIITNTAECLIAYRCYKKLTAEI